MERCPTRDKRVMERLVQQEKCWGRFETTDTGKADSKLRIRGTLSGRRSKRICRSGVNVPLIITRGHTTCKGKKQKGDMAVSCVNIKSFIRSESREAGTRWTFFLA